MSVRNPTNDPIQHDLVEFHQKTKYLIFGSEFQSKDFTYRALLGAIFHDTVKSFKNTTKSLWTRELKYFIVIKKVAQFY